jgi:hypothetical protein
MQAAANTNEASLSETPTVGFVLQHLVKSVKQPEPAATFVDYVFLLYEPSFEPYPKVTTRKSESPLATAPEVCQRQPPTKV